MSSVNLEIYESDIYPHYFDGYVKQDSVEAQVIKREPAGGDISGKRTLGNTVINGVNVCTGFEFRAAVYKSEKLEYAAGIGVPPGTIGYLATPNSHIVVRISYLEFSTPPPANPSSPEPTGIPDDVAGEYESYSQEEWDEIVLIREGLNERVNYQSSYDNDGAIYGKPIISPIIPSVQQARDIAKDIILRSWKSKNINLSIPPFFELIPGDFVKALMGEVSAESPSELETIEINMDGKRQETKIYFKAKSSSAYVSKQSSYKPVRGIDDLQAEIDKYNSITSEAERKVDDGENYKYGKVEKVHPDGTYDCIVLGSGLAINGIKAVDTTEKYIIGDTVLISLSYGDIKFPQIQSRAAFNFPEETVTEFTDVIPPVEQRLYLAIATASKELLISDLDGENSETITTPEIMGGGICNYGDYIYINSLYGTYDIYKYDLDGNYEDSFGVLNGSSLGIATDGEYIFACCTTAFSLNPGIYRFNMDGTGSTVIVRQGTGDGFVRNPYGITINSSGNILVADKNNNRVQELTTAGVYVSKFTSPDNPYGICIDSSGNIYTGDYFGVIRKYNSVGVLLDTWTTPASSPPSSTPIHYLAVDENDNIYATCETASSVYVYSSSGSLENTLSISSARGITIV